MVDPRRFGFPFEFVTGLPHDDYTARVLGRVCAAVLDYTNGQRPCGRLVNFRELPDVIWDRLTNFFGAEYDDTERALMQKAATLNSKNPVLQHEDDTVTKQREANEVLRELADRWLRDTYQKLESRRLVACAEDR
jgi:predicted transcriptional regulator